MGQGTAGGARVRITETGAEARLEPIVTQDPQHILRDAGGGVADKSHPARLQIGEASDRIMHRAVGIEKNRVDCEVAPRRIGRPVGVEGDAGAAAVSLDVAPQGGDLEMARRGAGNRGYGAVGKTGRHDLDAALLQQLDYALRRRRRGDIDVANPLAE